MPNVTSMEELLRLQTRFQSLSQDEFVEGFAKEFWINLIFNYFYCQLQNNPDFQTNINEIQTINNKINKIIISRKAVSNPSSDDESSDEVECIQFDELPSSMISSVASYLQFIKFGNL